MGGQQNNLECSIVPMATALESRGHGFGKCCSISKVSVDSELCGWCTLMVDWYSFSSAGSGVACHTNQVGCFVLDNVKIPECCGGGGQH